MEDSQRYSDNEYITLVSAEGFEFFISKKAAVQSKMLKEMMSAEDGPFGEMNRITLPDISTPILEMVCEYLCERRIRGAYLSSFAPLEKLDPTKEEDRLLVIEVLLAANYMDC